MNSRGRAWFERFAAGGVNCSDLPPSVLAADIELHGLPVRAIAVVPDPHDDYHRARNGEIGIAQGYGVAKAVSEAPDDAGILAIVDVPGQAFGRREEEDGLQRSLAAAANAYIVRRQSGGPVASLIVGKAISGAFLAHGAQAGWIAALRDSLVEVHVMSAAAAARVTRMSPEAIARIAREIPATARDVESFASLGGIDELFTVADPDAPAPSEFENIAHAIAHALASPSALRAPRRLPRDIASRIDAQWNA
jgi:biotin-independent malonate decarboxylase gamma subunit